MLPNIVLLLGFAVLAAGVATVGVLAWRRRHSPSSHWKLSWLLGVVIVVAIALTWLSHGLAKANYSDILEDVRQVPASQVEAVIIQPMNGHYPNLVSQPVRIDDPGQIAQIVSLIQSAPEYLPNHPGPTWECELALDFGDRIRYCDVGWEDPRYNGLIIRIWSGRGQGWVLGTYRQDSLAPILEAAAARQGQQRGATNPVDPNES
jgi:hypothetical protein